jgi:hypothetical protein
MGHASGGLVSAIVGEVPTGVSPDLDAPRPPCATPGCRSKALGSSRRRAPKAEEGPEETTEAPPPAKSGMRKKAKANPALCRRCQNAAALELLRQSEVDDEARLKELHAGYSRR